MYFFGGLKDVEGDKITGKKQILEMISQGPGWWNEMMYNASNDVAMQSRGMHYILVSWFFCIKYMFDLFKAMFYSTC